MQVYSGVCVWCAVVYIHMNVWSFVLWSVCNPCIHLNQIKLSSIKHWCWPLTLAPHQSVTTTSITSRIHSWCLCVGQYHAHPPVHWIALQMLQDNPHQQQTWSTGWAPLSPGHNRKKTLSNYQLLELAQSPQKYGSFFWFYFSLHTKSSVWPCGSRTHHAAAWIQGHWLAYATQMHQLSRATPCNSTAQPRPGSHPPNCH